MEILYKNPEIRKPRVSFVLLDWSCRESFHFLHYINNQTVPRDTYEVIWIEYYSRRPAELQRDLENSLKSKGRPLMDQWIVMDMPDDVYYHKHLMYNIGMALAHGDIITICDSDAIVQDDFVETIAREFDRNPEMVLHMDEVRNNDRKFYPFNYPPLKEVIGKGAINYKDGTTTGLLDDIDPLHSRNYGACMSARRADLIAIGGADEHIDYLGHVCGPYELTFRLRNFKREEVWHPNHLLYHVWHPGQAGDNNYVGPHDGRHMSTTALETITSGRILPLKENPVIQSLRLGDELTGNEMLNQLIRDENFKGWRFDTLTQSDNFYLHETAELLYPIENYNLVLLRDTYYAIPQCLGPIDIAKEGDRKHPQIITGKSESDIKAKVRKLTKNKGFKFLGSISDYNLAHLDGTFYAIPQSLGPADISNEEDRNNPEILSSGSERLLRKQIKKLAQSKGLSFCGSVEQYNIVRVDGTYYAVPQKLGPVDLTQEQERKHPEILTAESASKLKKSIKALINSHYRFPLVRSLIGPRAYSFLSNIKKRMS